MFRAGTLREDKLVALRVLGGDALSAGIREIVRNDGADFLLLNEAGRLRYDGCEEADHDQRVWPVLEAIFAAMTEPLLDRHPVTTLSGGADTVQVQRPSGTACWPIARQAIAQMLRQLPEFHGEPGCRTNRDKDIVRRNAVLAAALACVTDDVELLNDAVAAYPECLEARYWDEATYAEVSPLRHAFQFGAQKILRHIDAKLFLVPMRRERHKAATDFLEAMDEPTPELLRLALQRIKELAKSPSDGFAAFGVLEWPLHDFVMETVLGGSFRNNCCWRVVLEELGEYLVRDASELWQRGVKHAIPQLLEFAGHVLAGNAHPYEGIGQGIPPAAVARDLRLEDQVVGIDGTRRIGRHAIASVLANVPVQDTVSQENVQWSTDATVLALLKALEQARPGWCSGEIRLLFKDHDGHLAHALTSYGLVDSLQFFQAHGGDLEPKMADGRTPAQLAADDGDSEMESLVRALVARGAAQRTVAELAVSPSHLGAHQGC